MSVTRLDIDDEALAEVMQLSGVATTGEAVNVALREYVERRRRAEARLRHFSAAQGWDEASSRCRHEAEKGAL